MSIKDIKFNLLSLFREFLVYHHRSLEFRAKFFAAIISVNTQIDEQIYDKLRQIALEIYGHDEKRIELLIRAVKEYVKKIVINNGLYLDELIKDLDRTMRRNRRYIQKINLNHLRRIQNKDDEDVKLIQQRIIEFAQGHIDSFKEEESKRSRKKVIKKD